MEQMQVIILADEAYAPHACAMLSSLSDCLAESETAHCTFVGIELTWRTNDKIK
jgi:hypothetical protein